MTTTGDNYVVSSDPPQTFRDWVGEKTGDEDNLPRLLQAAVSSKADSAKVLAIECMHPDGRQEWFIVWLTSQDAQGIAGLLV